MEQLGHTASFEISGTTSRVQERLRKSQALYYKSGQLEDYIFLDQSPRLVYIDDPKRTNDKYEFTSNEIRTSKYTLFNFLPKNLFIQFHRVAYLYFLAIAALNQLPPLAVFGRTVSLFPLLFVLSVTAVKDGYEDWRRHRSDKKENNREALVLQSGGFEMKKWKNIEAGEIVKIFANETIPCDIMCSVVALGMGLWLRHKEQLDTLPYYRKLFFSSGKEGKTYKYYGVAMETFFAFLSSIIVFQIMIPISLYITMELVRLGQSYFMIGDKHMYDSSSDSRFQCRSLNINEDLGQIRYIFSDKTGTLTQNKMEFRTACIHGKMYGTLSSSARPSQDQSLPGNENFITMILS